MNKTALITGASSGIGKAIANTLIEEGYTVFATSRRVDMMQDLAVKGAITIKMDVTSTEEIAEVVNMISQKVGQLDLLINNAGYGQFGTIEETCTSLAKAQFDTNVFGLASVTKEALPLLRKGTNPKIINISSIAARVMMPGGAWYSASKHAVSALTTALRFEVENFGIKVSLIEPGPIKTNFGVTANSSMKQDNSASLYKDINNAMDKLSNPNYSVGVAGKTDDITKVIRKIINKKSPKARYVVTPVAWWLDLATKLLPDNVIQWGYKQYLKSLV